MKSKRKSLYWPVSTVSSIAMLSVLSVAQAATIDSWNHENVIVDEPADGYVLGETYDSTVYTDTTMTTTNGAVIWKQGSVVAPGAQVLTNSPPAQNPEDPERNCIITTGTNRSDPASPPKTCSDAFQSAKRVKTDARAADTSLDLVFDVTAGGFGDGTTRTYRVFQKYINSLLTNMDMPIRMDGFTIQLGTGIGNGFNASDPDDGLAFTARDGSPVPTNSIPPGDSDLGSLMSAGLFGDAMDNTNVIRDGYFYLPDDTITGLDGSQCNTDPSGKGRSYFNLTASEDLIQTNGNVQGLHYCLFGNMLGQGQLPFGYFFDEDGDLATDAMTVANWNGTGWETYAVIDPVTGLVQLDSNGNYMRPENPPVDVPPAVLAMWCNQPENTDGIPFYFVTVLDDMGLTNNNYHITVSEKFESVNSTFTLRITNSGEAEPPLPTPWLEFSPPEVLPDFSCPPIEPPPAVEVDVAIKKFDVDDKVRVKETSRIKVYLTNYGPDAASGTVTVTGTDSRGKIVAALSAGFTDLAANEREVVSFKWTAPRKPTVIRWVAEVVADGDSDLSNNTATATTKVSDKRRKKRGDDDD